MKQAFYLLLFLTLSTFARAQDTIPLKINDYGLLFVEAEIDGQSGTFIFDTGAGMHVVSGKFFDKLKGGLEPAGIYTGFRHDGDRIDAELFRAEKLILSDSAIQRHPIIGVYPPLDEYGIDGLVSLKLFEHRPITLDIPGKRLILESQEKVEQLAKKATSIPITLEDSRNKALDIFITLCLENGRQLEAEFDTGSGFELLLLNQHFLDLNQQQQATIDSTGLLKLPTTTFSLCSTPEQQYTSGRALSKRTLIYEALVGSGVFREQPVIIDIPKRRMIIYP